jgi:hypothetical protein
MMHFGQSLISQAQAARKLELFIEHIYVSHDQSVRLFFHFCSKITTAEPVCGQRIVMARQHHYLQVNVKQMC